MAAHATAELPVHADARTVGGPLVSILMPNYNGAAYLAAAVESALAQRYRDLEIVIVDDGSTDGSLEILERFAAAHPERIRLFTHEGHVNRGLVETYRLALSRAEGEIVAFLESDDLWRPDNLEKKVAILRRHPEVGVVHADFRPFGSFRGSLYWGLYGWTSKRSLPAGRPYHALGAFLVRNPIPSFTHFIARRSLLERVPALSVVRRNYDWWVLAHLSTCTQFYFIPEKLTSWRIHRTSSHYGPARVPFDTVRQFQAALYESLLASETLAQDPQRIARVGRARSTLCELEQIVHTDRRRLVRFMLRRPIVFLCLGADVLLRRVLFS